MKWAPISHNIFSKCTKFSISWCKRLMTIISKWPNIDPPGQYIDLSLVRKSYNVSTFLKKLHILKYRTSIESTEIACRVIRWEPPWPDLTSHDLVTCDDTPGRLESDALARRKAKTWWRRTSERKRRSVLSHERKVNEPHRGLMYGPAWGRSLAERRRCKPH